MNFKGLKNSFITGLLLLAPLGVTIFVVNLMIDKIGAPASGIFLNDIIPPDLLAKEWVEYSAKAVSTLFVIILITIFGFLSKYFLGKFTVRITESLIARLPFINTVYKTVKQIVETFSKQKEAVFQKTVLVEYPRKGAYALGFLTGDSKGEVQVRTGKDMLNIFIPTTPNPTSGFLLMIPSDEVMELEMAVGDGMKLIISGGAVVPPYPLLDKDRKVSNEIKVQNPELPEVNG